MFANTKCNKCRKMIVALLLMQMNKNKSNCKIEIKENEKNRKQIYNLIYHDLFVSLIKKNI